MSRNIIYGMLAAVILLAVRMWWVGTQSQKHAKAVETARALERGEAPPVPPEIERKIKEAEDGAQRAEVPKGVRVVFVRRTWSKSGGAWRSEQSPLVASYKVYAVAEGRRSQVSSGTTPADGTPLPLDLPPGKYEVVGIDGDEYSASVFTVSPDGRADVRVVLSTTAR